MPITPAPQILNTTFTGNSKAGGDGGVLAAYGGHVAISQSVFESNEAGRGGALFVDGAHVTLEDRTQLDNNAATVEGASVYAMSGSVRYLLPAKLGHWVASAVFHIPSADEEIPNQLLWRWERNVPGSPTYDSAAKEYDGRLVQPVRADGAKASAVYRSPIENSTGLVVVYQKNISSTMAIDENFPFACEPGFYREHDDYVYQDGPQCEAICPVGTYCPAGTPVPLPCHHASYCPIGSGYPISCPAGTWTNQTDLTAACLLYTSPSPRDGLLSRMPSSA